MYRKKVAKVSIVASLLISTNLFAGDEHLIISFGSNWYVNNSGNYITTNVADISTIQVEDIDSNVTKPTGATLTLYSSSGTQKSSSDNLANGDYLDVNNSGIGRRYTLFGIQNQISAGEEHTLVLLDGVVYSFGRGSNGQLGHGDTSDQTSPKKIEVAGENNITAISAGNSYSLLLDKNGSVYSFGYGSNGQLGHGDTNRKFSPTKINFPPKASSVSISGTLEVAQTLTGSYSFSGSNSESGTTYQWYRADDSLGTNTLAISDTNSTTYTTTSDDGGKYVRFGVTPKDGITFGSEANSSYTQVHITTPTAFNFTDVTSQELSTAITSNQITVSSITKAVAISISGSGCEYLIANALRSANIYTWAAGTISSGEKVDIKVTSSASYSTTTNCILTIGGVSDTFSVTTKEAPVPQTDVIVPISGFEGDVTIPPNLEPIELTDGTNQFNVENTNSNTVINIPPENSDKKEVDIIISSNEVETKIIAPKDAKFSVKSDGSITQSMTIKDTKIEVSAKSSGEAEIKKERDNSQKVVSLPAGTNINMSEDSSVVGVKEVVADVASSEKPMKIEAQSTPNEELKVTAIVENQAYSLSTREESYQAKVELMEKSSTSRETKVVYSGIKSTFKSKLRFTLVSNNKRDVLNGEIIEIFPLTSWQKFEEKQYFDGRRTITLVAGGANFIIDGDLTPIEKGVEYLIGEFVESVEPTTIIEETTLLTQTDTTVEEIEESSTFIMELKSGWNLITTPINETITKESYFENAEMIYTYENGWFTPTELKPARGYWVKLPKDKSIEFTKESYTSNYTAIDSWDLFGAGEDIDPVNLNQFNQILIYNSNEWVKNPSTIKRGQGFWAK